MVRTMSFPLRTRELCRRSCISALSKHCSERPARRLAHTAAFFVSLRWHSSQGNGSQGTRHKTAHQSVNVSEKELQETAEKAEMDVRWSGGSSYYFSEEEKERLSQLHSPLVHSVESGRSHGAVSIIHAGSTSRNRGGKEDAVWRAVIHGVARSFSIDLTIPPVRREEVERWKLDGPLLRKGIDVKKSYAHGSRAYHHLLPPTAMVTYLGPDMRKIDQLHRQKGFFTPSEVAEVFIPLVPTFPVESRHVMATVPPEILKRIESVAGSTSTLAQVIFEHYPMLFHYTPNRYRPAVVQLNSEFWFVRQHPGYGKADRALSQFRSNALRAFDAPGTVDDTSGVEPLYAAAEKAAAETAPSLHGRGSSTSQRRPWSVEMLAVLVRNLPRVPTPACSSEDSSSVNEHTPSDGKPLVRERYRPLNLVQWINAFSADDLAFVSKTHETSVVQLITQYVHVFQLMSLKKGDHNLFVERHVLLSGGAGSKCKADVIRPPPAAASATEDSENGGEASLARGAADEEDALSGWWSVDGDYAHKESGNSKSSSDDRERVFKQAVAEEMIGLDGLMEDCGGSATELEPGGDAAAFGDDAEEAGDTAFSEDGDGEVGQQGGIEDYIYQDGKSNDDAASPSPPYGNDLHPKQGPPRGASMDAVTAFGVPLEEIYIRRLPPDVAPRSLSDLDETTSPDPELLSIAASFLASPPSLRSPTSDCFFRRQRQKRWRVVKAVDEVWRWVAVERLYGGFTTEQRRCLRERYRGLVGFLRYHGKLFELSGDLMYVIAHDPRGTMAPIPPMERVFRYANRVILPDDFDDNPDRSASLPGEVERRTFTRVLGEGAIPSVRRHLLLLDPDNPLMQHEVLYDEIAKLLPDHPVPYKEMLAKLPPVIRAALPHALNFAASKSIEVFTEKGKTMVRKKKWAQPGAAPAESRPQTSVEEAIAELLQLPIGKEGISVKALVGMHLSVPAANTLSDHFGSVTRAVRMLPQYFEVWQDNSVARKKLVMVRLRE
ncbi:hypothetical protein, conserved [Leishmania tarentolae]|uniref:Uncharacterized protein n=1 Tax=Leishmania tarentolae TaxID=5689 RepID=A0A640KXH7_LEITA|nr:hypothetical protein, conserved [Leishmania tarentolae]